VGGNPDSHWILLTCVQTLPSDPSPEPEASRLALTPFHGVRYAADRVSGVANVTSPPYDVIGPGNVQRLLAEPHNVVRLILPGSESAQPPDRFPGPEDYQAAAGTLHDWLGSGVLFRDPRPALYVYEQSVPADGAAGWEVVQRGLIGALRLVPPTAPSVLPHEDVMPGPVTGRRELMETTSANLEPIFLLYDSGENAAGPAAAARRDVPELGPHGAAGTRGGATGLVDRVADGRKPLLTAVTDDGLRHRLWAMTDPAEHETVASDLAGRSALIADGHHRYAAYLQLQERKRAAGRGSGPWDYGLAFLVDSAAYPPRIGAIHRAVPGLSPAHGAKMAEGSFTVRPAGGDLDEAVTALAEAGRDGPAFLLTDGTEHYLLTEPRADRAEAAMPGGRSDRWRGLAASVLRELLIKAVWGLRDEEPDVTVVQGDPAAAVRAARETDGTAVLCNPVSAEDVRAVAANGERMPRKSTSFGPKPRTGVVMRTFG
jgi:uncharacterized protein (DUF1015 family)